MPNNFGLSLSSAIPAVLLASTATLAVAADIVTSPPNDPRESAGYWTAERKATAQPMPLVQTLGEPIAAPFIESTGEPGSIAGNPPADESGFASEEEIAVQPQFPGDGTDTIWYDYPPPSNIYHAPFAVLRARFPLSTLGKLFFSDGTSNYVCSAQSVTSAGSWGNGNRQTVVTAGHCCSDGAGTFFSNLLFEPAHHEGSAPLGSWTGFDATVFTAWHTTGDLSVDLCVIQMNTLNGNNINDAVGALGYTWNRPLPQEYTATGWPAASPFSGGKLYLNHASDAETDTAQAGVVDFTHGIGNRMTGGSSGGAWIVSYNPSPAAPASSTNFFNGLNSYKYTNPNRPLEMFGPYINDLFVTLLQTVATAPAAP